MAQPPRPEASDLQRALEELHAQRAAFSPASFDALLHLLHEALGDSTPLSPEADATATDEIRLVTVLFIDVTDSTRITQQIGASDWKNLLAEAHRRLAQVVAQWEGQVGQYLGDGLLCFFGARRSGGDDAMRAVACALTLQATLQSYANEVFLQHGIDFTTRIGISSGRLVVGMVGHGDHQERLALGPATNLAARLQSLAEPGAIVIDEATYYRTRSTFVTQRQPPMTIKGYDEPIVYYRVQGARHAARVPLTDDHLHGVELQFVGREAELQIILDAYDRAIQQCQLQTVTFVGEVGIGKSRLLMEALHIFRSRGDEGQQLIMRAAFERRTAENNLLHDLLVDQCDLNIDMPADEASERVRAYIRKTWSGDDAIPAADIIAYLGGFGDLESPHVRAFNRSRQAKQSANEWITRWLTGLARKGPLLLVIDNLQWADTASIEMLNAIALGLSNQPVLMLAAGRPEYDQRAPRYLDGLPDARPTTLEPLASGATLRLINTVLDHVERVPSSLPMLIQNRAVGNPLFVVEFLNMLFDQGVFQLYEHDTHPDDEHPVTSSRWRFNIIPYDSVMSDLPDGLIGITQARLDDLPLLLRAVLQVGAVVGDTFWEGTVASMLPNLEVGPLLDQLTVRGLIAPVPESVFRDETQYIFRHALYRTVAYEMIPRAKRESHHQQVTQWLVTRIADKPELYILLTEQFEAAGMYEEALYTCLEAVQNRFERNVLREALTLVEQGLSLARKVAREIALPITSRLWLLRSQVLVALEKYEEASAAANAALMLMKELPDTYLTHQRSVAARTLGTALRGLGQYAEAHDALEIAMATSDESDRAHRSGLLVGFGILWLYQGALADARGYLLRARELALATRQFSLLNGALAGLGLVALDTGELALSLSYFETVLASNQQQGNHHLIAKDLRSIGLLYWKLMCYDRALLVFNEADTLRRQHRGQDTLLQAYRGLCLSALGHVDAGHKLFQEIRPQDHVDPYHAQQVQLAQLVNHNLTGRYDVCRQQAEQYIPQVEPQNPLLAARAQYQLALALLAQNDPGALPLLRTALTLEEKYGGADIWQICVQLAEHDPDAADRQHYRLRAATLLHHLADSLNDHPDLQASFRRQPQLAWAFPTEASEEPF